MKWMHTTYIICIRYIQYVHKIGTHTVTVRWYIYICVCVCVEFLIEGIIIASKICTKTTLIEYINVEHELIDLQCVWIEPLIAAVLGCSIRRCNIRRSNQEDACGHRSYLFIYTNVLLLIIVSNSICIIT